VRSKIVVMSQKFDDVKFIVGKTLPIDGAPLTYFG